VQDYRIRGRALVWYQGEGNTWLDPSVSKIVPAIGCVVGWWRKGLGEGDFPFLIVKAGEHGARP